MCFAGLGVRLLIRDEHERGRQCLLQVQHVFTVLGTSGGGTRRSALAELRRDYARHHKHGGKV